MSSNSTPSSERVCIGFFGVRNAGKSSLVNALTGQDLAVVSSVAGTTTDPVRKAMELLPLGPVLIVDTPGIDDTGDLGGLRVEKTRKVLGECDIAVLVTQAGRKMTEDEAALESMLVEKKIPYLRVENKADLLEGDDMATSELEGDALRVSALSGRGVEELKERLSRMSVKGAKERRLVADFVKPGDTVVFVIPIDGSAPKGRIILPQQMALRDVLDAHAVAVCCQVHELTPLLERMGDSVSLVVADSQVFEEVSSVVAPDVAVTSFSILMARYKGVLGAWADAAGAIARLADGDGVLISEGCTHHRQCDDIGSVKIPRWMREFSNVEPSFAFTSGKGFPDDLSPYKLIVHCGGCMLGDRELANRMASAKAAGVPFVNYGVAIAYMRGVLDRAMSPLSQC